METQYTQPGVSPTLVQQIDEIGNAAGHRADSDIVALLDTDEGYDEDLHKQRVQRYPAELVEALNHAEYYSGYRCIPTGYLAHFLVGRFRLLRLLHYLYPKTWVDRAVALVLLNARKANIADRLAELQKILVEFVQNPTHYEPRFRPDRRNRVSANLQSHLRNELRDAGMQKRNLDETVWLVGYFLDCYECHACEPFSRSLEQIMADAPDDLKMVHRTTASRIIGRVTEEWSGKQPRLSIFRCLDKGYRTTEKQLASEFDLNPDFAYLLDIPALSLNCKARERRG